MDRNMELDERRTFSVKPWRYFGRTATSEKEGRVIFQDSSSDDDRKPANRRESKRS